MVAARVAGQGGGGDAALLHGLGLIGALILYFVNKRREKAESTLKAATPQWDLDQSSPKNPEELRGALQQRRQGRSLAAWGTLGRDEEGATLANLNFELAQPAKPLTLAIRRRSSSPLAAPRWGVALGSQLTFDAKLGGVQLAAQSGN